MPPESDGEVNYFAYYKSAVGPHPLTGQGTVPTDLYDSQWYPEIQGWSALYYGGNALVLVMAPTATHQIMAASTKIHILNQHQVAGIKQAIKDQQGLARIPDMGVTVSGSNRQRLFIP